MKFIGTDIERDVKKALKSYIPKYYNESKVVDEVLRVDAEELEKLYGRVSETLSQFFINTATWGLDIWEEQFGLSRDPSMSYSQRRSRLKAKITGSGTFTPADAKALANQYSEPQDAEYVEVDGAKFKTRHNVDHLIDYKGLIFAFDEMKPAHLQHIVGLLIRLSSEPKMVQKSLLKQHLLERYDFLTFITYRLQLYASFIGFGPWYNVPTEYKLYLNGAWTFDGNSTLDGKNPDGVELYNQQADKIHFRYR